MMLLYAVDVSKLLENFSPDQRKSLMQQLQAEKEKGIVCVACS